MSSPLSVSDDVDLTLQPQLETHPLHEALRTVSDPEGALQCLFYPTPGGYSRDNGKSAVPPSLAQTDTDTPRPQHGPVETAEP